MSQYKKGVENLPLRNVNTDCPIIVIVTDLIKNEIVETIEMNYAKIEDRKWLGRLSFWAVSNHHSIETMAKTDAEFAPVEND